ncbi:MAG: manganese efflux pump, partial [Clostridiales bacterium]|nr:manganese efflux pump [Clostridiales bacterium]
FHLSEARLRSRGGSWGWGKLLLLAVRMSVDAFLAALWLGGAKSGMTWRYVVYVASCFTALQVFFPCLGYLLGYLFGNSIAAVDHWLVFLTMGAIGCHMIAGACQEGRQPRRKAEDNAVAMAVAVSCDSVAVGVSLAAMGEPVLLSISMLGGACLIAAVAGLLLGKSMPGLRRPWIQAAGGLVLLGLGAKLLWEHLH